MSEYIVYWTALYDIVQSLLHTSLSTKNEQLQNTEDQAVCLLARPNEVMDTRIKTLCLCCRKLNFG